MYIAQWENTQDAFLRAEKNFCLFMVWCWYYGGCGCSERKNIYVFLGREPLDWTVAYEIFENLPFLEFTVFLDSYTKVRLFMVWVSFFHLLLCISYWLLHIPFMLCVRVTGTCHIGLENLEHFFTWFKVQFVHGSVIYIGFCIMGLASFVCCSVFSRDIYLLCCVYGSWEHII